MIEITDKMLATMRSIFDPPRYYGFLSGMAFAHLCRDLEQDAETPRDGELLRFATLRDNFVAEQKAAGEPDGRRDRTLYWADLYPQPCEDRDEIVACCEHGCVVMLCSTVEPHVQWFVTLSGGDDGDVTEFFSVQAQADRFLRDTLEEGRKQRADAIDRAWDLAASNKAREAGELCDEFGIAFSHDFQTGIIKIDGVPNREADGPEDRAAADDGA